MNAHPTLAGTAVRGGRGERRGGEGARAVDGGESGAEGRECEAAGAVERSKFISQEPAKRELLLR